MKTIKIDVDGVLRNIIPTMCSIYNEKYSDNIQVEDVTDYYVKNIFTKCEKAEEFFFIEHGKDVFLYSSPFKYTREALLMLHNAGYKIIICTWQINNENKKHTLDFLSINDLYYDDICFTHDKYIVDADIMVDDNPEFLNDETNQTVEKILIDAPYNRDVNVSNSKRFSSLYDYVVELLKK